MISLLHPQELHHLQTPLSWFFNSQRAATGLVLLGAGNPSPPNMEHLRPEKEVQTDLHGKECAFTSWCKSQVPKNFGFDTTSYHHHASNGSHSVLTWQPENAGSSRHVRSLSDTVTTSGSCLRAKDSKSKGLLNLVPNS